MSKGQLPDLLFVAPIGMPRQKIRHKRVVFLVEACDADGIPSRLRLCANEREKIDVDTDPPRRFITAYIQEPILRPNADAANFRDQDYRGQA